MIDASCFSSFVKRAFLELIASWFGSLKMGIASGSAFVAILSLGRDKVDESAYDSRFGESVEVSSSDSSLRDPLLSFVLTLVPPLINDVAVLCGEDPRLRFMLP